MNRLTKLYEQFRSGTSLIFDSIESAQAAKNVCDECGIVCKLYKNRIKFNDIFKRQMAVQRLMDRNINPVYDYGL